MSCIHTVWTPILLLGLRFADGALLMFVICTPRLLPIEWNPGKPKSGGASTIIWREKTAHGSLPCPRQ